MPPVSEYFAIIKCLTGVLHSICYVFFFPTKEKAKPLLASSRKPLAMYLHFAHGIWGLSFKHHYSSSDGGHLSRL